MPGGAGRPLCRGGGGRWHLCREPTQPSAPPPSVIHMVLGPLSTSLAPGPSRGPMGCVKPCRQVSPLLGKAAGWPAVSHMVAPSQWGWDVRGLCLPAFLRTMMRTPGPGRPFPAALHPDEGMRTFRGPRVQGSEVVKGVGLFQRHGGLVRSSPSCPGTLWFCVSH